MCNKVEDLKRDFYAATILNWPTALSTAHCLSCNGADISTENSAVLTVEKTLNFKEMMVTSMLKKENFLGLTNGSAVTKHTARQPTLHKGFHTTPSTGTSSA